jgi:RecB family endonuclease NucS
VNANTLREAQLVQHLDQFARQLDLRELAREVKIGAYRVDAVAADPSGNLVVIEFKVNASMTALSQLLLYPHALHKALERQGCIPPPAVRARCGIRPAT